jgi:hypothetical protein
MNRSTLYGFAQEIEHLSKTSGLRGDWKNFGSQTLKDIGHAVWKFPVKHPGLTLAGLLGVPSAIWLSQTFGDPIYHYHLLGQSNRLAREQNERLDNLQKIQQAQLSQSLGIAHPALYESMRPKIVASPLS